MGGRLRKPPSISFRNEPLSCLPFKNCCPDLSSTSLPGPALPAPNPPPLEAIPGLHIPTSLDQGRVGSLDLLALLGGGRGSQGLLSPVGPSSSMPMEDVAATSIGKSQYRPWAHKKWVQWWPPGWIFPEPQNVTLFGVGVFADAIKVRLSGRDHPG